MKPLRILVIDDEQSVQRILSSFLQRYAQKQRRELQLCSLSNPADALLEMTTAGERYHAILLDVRIPKMGGDEIFHDIREVHPKIIDRILFVTGYPEDLYKLFPQHELKVLHKPFRYHQLHNALDQLLEPTAPEHA
ncbi:MAG: response regulator [Zetaproteobacteria bacterium]|nr:MAG: response regulator [Zetaproteobacteria bacterium]